jgi:hypothetical protein
MPLLLSESQTPSSPDKGSFISLPLFLPVLGGESLLRPSAEEDELVPTHIPFKLCPSPFFPISSFNVNGVQHAEKSIVYTNLGDHYPFAHVL